MSQSTPQTSSSSTTNKLPTAQNTQIDTQNNGSRHNHRHGRRRPIKCTFPSCGKYGHYTSQCWKAHPELRPYRGGARGGQRGSGNSDDQWPTSTPAWNKPKPIQPFRFLDLPQEVQDKVYDQVYAKEWDLGVCMKDRSQNTAMNNTDIEEEKLDFDFRGYGFEDWGLLRACKMMRKDSRTARMKAFSGHMGIGPDKEYQMDAFDEIRKDKYAGLRSRITSLGIGTFSGRTQDYLDAQYWSNMHSLFPNVTEIRLVYEAFRRQHIERESYQETREWQATESDTYADDFAAGRLDGSFMYPVENLSVQSLAQVFEDAGHDCRITLSNTVVWTNNRYHAVFWQMVKFLVTTNTVVGIERK